MHDFSLLFYFISLGVLWSQPLCKGATHWMVTEDGRIQQQVDSAFNLKRPYDLVNFIRQESVVDRLKILREEYLVEKLKVIEAREKERAEVQKSFHEIDPDCIDAGKHISEFELHLEMTLPFTKKGINIPDHLSLCQSLPSNVEPPFCRAELPTVVYSYDHLVGVNGRHQLNATAEPSLLTALSYFKTVEELGGQVSLALQKNSSSWILLNLAAYYWRIKGNAPQAVECLRQALYYSPREHKDRALMSLAAVLHYANHTLDSVVLLHAALDTCDEYSVYHFLLGNIYASLKMYEMAQLCYQFTITVSPDTELLCERLKGVRCQLKFKEHLKERQLAFDERLDSLNTPELDEPDEESNSVGAEKKHGLPLEAYKRQLAKLYKMTEGIPRDPEFCKSRPVPVKQDSHLTEKTEVGTTTDSLQNYDLLNENASSEKQDKSNSAHRPTEASADPKTKLKTSEDKSGKMILTEKSDVSETLEATNSGQTDNSNISAEEKTLQDLEVSAQMALSRLKNNRWKIALETVTGVSSASKTVDVASDKGVKIKGNEKTVSNKPSSVDSASKVQYKKTEDKKSEIRKGNAGRRGESGLKMLKRDATASKEDASRTVLVDDAKLAKQKGESILMSKNGPGSTFPSKNTRDMPTAEILFEQQQSKASLPIGPKHTPPLKEKESSAQVRKCENSGRKKRKGEAFTVECLNQDSSKLVESSATESDTAPERPVTSTEFSNAASNEQSTTTTGSKPAESSGTKSSTAPEQALTSTEFSKAASNEQSATRSDVPALESDAEAVLMKQTTTDEISATASSDSTASKRTSEAKVLEKSEKKNTVVENLKSENSKSNGEEKASANGNKNSDVKTGEDVSAKRKTGDGQIKHGKQNDQATPNDSKISEVKVLETSGTKTVATDDVRSKSNDKGTQNGKQHQQTTANGSGNSEVEITETSEKKSVARNDTKSKTSNKEIQNGKQHKQTTASSSENSGAKVLEKSQRKDEDVAERKASDRKVVDKSKTPEKKILENSAGKTSVAKSEASDKNVDKEKDEVGTKVITGNRENSSDRQVSASSNVNKELPAADAKSRKVLEAKKASQNIKEQVKNAEFLHSAGAGSSVFETSFMNVHTDGSLQDLSDEECKHIEGVQALIVRNKQFSAWLSLDTKNVDVRAHIDFLSDMDDFSKKPRCTAKMKSNLHTFSSLQGVINAANLDQVAEVGLTQTLLTIGRTIQDSVDEMGTRIYNALKKNSSSWVLLNVASLYWRVQGDTTEAIKCLRQALYHSPSSARDVAHVGLASILLREGQLEDTAVVIKKALEISPSLALGHFILGNVFGAQNNIPEAIQHYLLALQLEPGFTPAVERLKIIQCVLWKQQKALEKEAADLKKLLNPN